MEIFASNPFSCKFNQNPLYIIFFLRLTIEDLLSSYNTTQCHPCVTGCTVSVCWSGLLVWYVSDWNENSCESFEMNKFIVSKNGADKSCIASWMPSNWIHFIPVLSNKCARKFQLISEMQQFKRHDELMQSFIVCCRGRFILTLLFYGDKQKKKTKRNANITYVQRMLVILLLLLWAACIQHLYRQHRCVYNILHEKIYISRTSTWWDNKRFNNLNI